MKGSESALEAFAMYSAGITNIAQIARELGKSTTWVRKALKQQGVVLDKTDLGILDVMSDADVEAMLKDYYSGVAIADLCERYHLSPTTFYAILRKLEIPPRTQAVEHEEGKEMQREMAVRMYEEGWVLWYIQEETGLYPNDILAAVREAGIEMRGVGQRGKTPKKDDEGKLEADWDAFDWNGEGEGDG